MKVKTRIAIIALIAIVAVSSLSITISFANATGNPDIQAVVSRPVERSWVKINGYINQWGTEKVSGLLQTQARTAFMPSEATKQLAMATAIWTTNNSRPINCVRSKENFTYTFYAARLNNASVSTLTRSADNYFLNGTWNLVKVVSTITVITNENNSIVSVHRDSTTTPSQAYGELSITENWSKFTLAISGQDELSGTVIRSMTRLVQFHPFKVVQDSTNKITHADLAAMAPCIHAIPGWGSYDTAMDFNGNFKIDIADISTVAANI